MDEPIKVRTYTGATAEEAGRRFQEDAATAFQSGYEATSQVWDRDSLTVTYRRRSPAVQSPSLLGAAAPPAPGFGPGMSALYPAPPVHVSNTVIVQNRSSGPGFLLRAVWFLFVGWWLSGLVAALAYGLCVTIIGLPFGFALFNRLPAVLTLRPRSEEHTSVMRDGVTYIQGSTKEQLPMVARIVWFVLIGWWLGAAYLFVAWLLCVSIIGLPIGLLLFNRVGAVMTLLRY